MTYLFYFYSFCVSIVLYLFIIKFIPVPQTSVPNDLLPFYAPYILPQSHKLLTYILAVIIIPSLTLFFNHLMHRFLLNFFKIHHKISTFLTYLSVVFSLGAIFLILFKSNITFPDINPLYILVASLSFIYFLYWYFHPQNFRVRFPGIIPLFIIALILITVFDRTMDDKDIFIGRTFQYVHSAVFIAPIFDILNGKVLLVDAVAQYGLLLNYIPSIIFKFIPLTFTNFFYLMIAYAAIYYLVISMLLKKIFTSVGWVLVGLITLFSLHFYQTADRFLRPMFFPIRYMLDIPFFLLLLLSDGKRRILRFLLPLYLAFAVFYNLETGASLIIAYLLYKFLYTFTVSEIASWQKKIIYMSKHILAIFFSLFILATLYTFYALSATGKLPDFRFAIYYISLYGSGFIASNGPQISFYLFTLLIYFAVIIRTLVKLCAKKLDRQNIFYASLAAYGLCLFIYYVERSFPPNLPSLSIPAIILGVGIFKEITQMRLSGHFNSPIEKIALFPCYLFLGSFILFAVLYYPVRLAGNVNFPYWQGDRTASQKLYDRLTDSALVINKYEPRAKSASIFSFYDTFFELASKKTNSLPYTSYQNVFTVSQAENVLKYISTGKPKYIYSNSEGWPETAVYPAVFDFIRKNYRMVESRELLDVWEKI